MIRKRVDNMTIWDDQNCRMRFRILKEFVFQVLGFINNQKSSQFDR